MRLYQSHGTPVLVVPQREIAGSLAKIPLDYSTITHNVAQNRFGTITPWQCGHVLFEGVSVTEFLGVVRNQGRLSEEGTQHLSEMRHEFSVINTHHHIEARLTHVSKENNTRQVSSFDFMPDGGWLSGLFLGFIPVKCEQAGNTFIEGNHGLQSELIRDGYGEYAVFKLTDSEFNILQERRLDFAAKCSSEQFTYGAFPMYQGQFNCASSVSALLNRNAFEYFVPAQLSYKTLYPELLLGMKNREPLIMSGIKTVFDAVSKIHNAGGTFADFTSTEGLHRLSLILSTEEIVASPLLPNFTDSGRDCTLGKQDSMLFISRNYPQPFVSDDPTTQYVLAPKLEELFDGPSAITFDPISDFSASCSTYTALTTLPPVLDTIVAGALALVDVFGGFDPLS